jgi:cytochrome b6-f complex iron-sulfur subunit
MNRSQFLKSLGFFGVTLIAAFMSCQSGEVAPVSPVDFDIDLNAFENIPLTRNGGYIVKNGVIVARVKPTYFVAVASTCSNDGQQMQFRNNEFYCPLASTRFDLSGRCLNDSNSKSLTTYKVEQKGSLLRIHS